LHGITSTLTDYNHLFISAQASLDLNKACQEKKGKTQPFLLCVIKDGSCENITLVTDKQPWLQFKEEVPSAIIALISSFYIFELAYPSDCAGALFFLQEFVASLPVKKSFHYSTYTNACLGILSTRQLNASNLVVKLLCRTKPCKNLGYQY